MPYISEIVKGLNDTIYGNEFLWLFPRSVPSGAMAPDGTDDVHQSS